MRFRALRKMWHVYERAIPFMAAVFSSRGLGSKEGRTLIRGKARRIAISFFPSYARHLQRKHGLTGGCTSCGASCNLLFRCPHWDSASHLCTVYEDRPNICKLFPITPADIKDRAIVLKDQPCGFEFKSPKKPS